MNIEASLIDRLQQLDSSVMSDVLDAAGLPKQVLAHYLRPLDLNCKLAGVALCATGRRVDQAAGKPASAAVSGYELERLMTAGKVLVIEAGLERHAAALGGFMAAAFKSSGCRGIVVNGAVRDSRELVDLGLPTFCASVTPVNSAKRWEVTSVEAPLQIPAMDGGFVTVRPGDYLLGDIDGIVVLPSQHAKQLIEDGEVLQRIEEQIRQLIREGATREQAFAKYPRFAHVRRPWPDA
jgi:4-hydroxy-4-methyl-2-oxoglutarate aldolase